MTPTRRNPARKLDLSAPSAAAICSAVASGMIAPAAIAFCTTVVMVQYSATAYSPRLVLWVARDPVVTHAKSRG